MPSLPDRKGHFGVFGGRYVAETIMPALIELEEAYRQSRKDKAFREELHYYLRQYAGRETPLYLAKSLTEKLGGAKIYLKREDLNHTGSHKINNTLGQALLARRMGKRRVIAETGRRTARGGHGHRGRPLRDGVPRLHGRRGHRPPGPQRVSDEDPGRRGGAGHLRHGHPQGRHERSHAGMGGAVRDTFYVIGSTAGPHPYPMMVRDFQSVIGSETRRQILKKEGRLPDSLIACVGGGSNAMGIFYPFKDDEA